jgi:uncharacterized delta-60 repeat protein
MAEGENAPRFVAGVLGFVTLAVLFIAAADAAAPLRGAIDRSFGHNGRFVSKLADALASSEFTAVVRQPDGKLVLTATRQVDRGGTEVVVQRRMPTGTFDADFGAGGTVIISRPGFPSDPTGLAMQADGGILVGVSKEGAKCDFVSVVRALQPNGTPDGSFGESGSTALPFSADRLAVDSRGRVLVAGAAVHTEVCIKGPAPRHELAVARLLPSGALDSSFGQDGIVEPHSENPGLPTFASGLVVREDGTILLAGSRSLVRLSANGTLDPSFGKDGVVEPAGGAKALLALPGGDAILASGASSYPCCVKPGDFVLSRYRPDGSLDNAFGSNGRATLDVAEFDEAGALALSPDGDIVLAGGAVGADGCRAGDCAFTPILARVTPDGALDPNFGHGGRIAVEPPGGSPDNGFSPWLAALAIAPSGRILAAGRTGRNSDGFIVARQANGQPDPAFGDAGAIDEVRTLPSRTELLDLAIGPSGKIFLSALSNAGVHISRGVLLALNSHGSVNAEIGGAARFAATEMFGSLESDGQGRVYQVDGSLVARFDGRGQRDRHYGSDGVARLPDHFAAGAFLVRDDGTVLVVGRFAFRRKMAAFRLTPKGLPDRGFGNGGLVEIGFGRTLATARAVAIDRRGRILLAGRAGLAAAVVRLLPDGRLDPHFGRHGRRANLPTCLADGAKVALQASGKILVAASPGTLARSRFTSLLRLRPNGALDRSFSRDGVVRVRRAAELLSLFVSGRQIVLATKRGFSGDGYGADLRAYRLDGGVDRRFGRNGVATVSPSFAGRAFRPAAVARQADGRIVVAGTARKLDGPGTAVAVFRFR